LAYGFHPSPFGEALIVTTPRGLAGLGWVSDGVDGGKVVGGRAEALADMMRRWPHAEYRFDPQATAPYAARIFDPAAWSAETPLRIVLIGTDFEVRVWETLLRIPVGRATTYGAVASRIGKPSASRAVGMAVGKNPISFVVPCHRVIGKSGALTGYHWGLTRKRAILGWEAGQIATG
ncbi:MAG: 6-O-methylguanine DNA methyltransferase, partial [Methylobacterium sp.]|nr:6-O-methylguanine DNA methyltransferase [Methylobacterium sp.]